MNINYFDSDTIRFIGIGVLLFFAVVSQWGKGQARSTGCLPSIREFIMGSLGILLFIYLAYPADGLAWWASETPKTDIQSPLDSTKRQVHYPPDTLPPKEQDDQYDFTPDRRRHYNVNPIPSDTIPPLNKLYDSDIEDKIYNSLESRHFYIQLSAGPSEDRMLKVKAKEEAKSDLNFYIGYDPFDVDYSYKLLVGPFPDKESAKQAWKGQKVWVRDLREAKQLVILTYP